MFLRFILATAILLGIFASSNLNITNRASASLGTLTWIAPDIANQTLPDDPPFGGKGHNNLREYSFDKVQMPLLFSLEHKPLHYDAPAKKDITFYYSQSLHSKNWTDSLAEAFQSHKILYISLFFVSSLVGGFLAAKFTQPYGPSEVLLFSHDTDEVHQKIAHHLVLSNVFTDAATTGSSCAPSSQDILNVLSVAQSTPPPSLPVLKDIPHSKRLAKAISPIYAFPKVSRKPSHEQMELGNISPEPVLRSLPVWKPSDLGTSLSSIASWGNVVDADLDEDTNNVTLVDDTDARTPRKRFQPSSYTKDWVTFEAPIQTLVSCCDDKQVEWLGIKVPGRTMRSIGTMTTGMGRSELAETIGHLRNAPEIQVSSRTMDSSSQASVSPLPARSKPVVKVNTRPKGWCICGMHEPNLGKH